MNIKNILKELVGAYPNAHVTESTILTYFRMLGSIPADELQAVVDQCLVECTFLPTIAEIVRRHKLLTRDLGIPSADQAWEEVRRTFGRVNRPDWSHPFIEDAVNVIGYRELCLSENQGNDMVRFIKIYNNLVERTDQVARLTPAARQLAERKTGLTSAGDIAKRLIATNGDGENV